MSKPPVRHARLMAANGPSNRHLSYHQLICYFARHQMSIRKSPLVFTWGRVVQSSGQMFGGFDLPDPKQGNQMNPTHADALTTAAWHPRRKG